MLGERPEREQFLKSRVTIMERLNNTAYNRPNTKHYKPVIFIVFLITSNLKLYRSKIRVRSVWWDIPYTKCHAALAIYHTFYCRILNFLSSILPICRRGLRQQYIVSRNCICLNQQAPKAKEHNSIIVLNSLLASITYFFLKNERRLKVNVTSAVFHHTCTLG